MSDKTENFWLKLVKQSGLTHSQLQIWTGQKVHAESPFCNTAFTIIIDSPIERELFQLAWQQVISNNDVMRSYVEEKDGMPFLHFHNENACVTEFIDLSDEVDAIKVFKDWAKIKCSLPLALKGELIDSTLVRLSEKKYGWYLNQHHLITDASASILLFKEVSQAYQSLVDQVGKTPAAGEREADLDECSRLSKKSYYEITETLFLETQETRKKSQAHWLSKQTGLQVRTNPLYGNHGDKNQTQSERIEYILSETEAEGLRHLSSELEFQSLFPDISLYAIFSTLMCALLYRISGQQQLSFDSPAGNRSNTAAKYSPGCFIEMFPFDIALDADDTFRTLGSRCMEEVKAFLVNVCPGASTTNGANASNVVLNFFAQPFGTFAGHEITAEWLSSGHIEGVYDFKLHVHDYNNTGQFTLQFDLSKEVFKPSDQIRIRDDFQALLSAMLDSLDTKVAACNILSDQEQIHILEDYNKADGEALPEKSIIELISAQVAATPNKLALRQLAKCYSFSELWSLVETLARTLCAKGVGKEKLVIVSMQRSTEAVITILAILRAGGAFTPIDPNYPVARLEKIIADSNACLILTHAGLGKKLPDGDIPVCDVATLLESEPENSIDLPLPALSDLAYVIYTSGSTGQPKGVEIEHGGMVDYLEWASRQYVRGEVLRFPLFTSLSFDLTITSLFLPLLSGGELIVYEQSNSEVDSALIDVINENVVDFIKLTPSHLALLRQMNLGDSCLSRMVVGGEDLKTSLALAIAEQFNDTLEIYNEYGPTECVVGCMIHQFKATENQGSSSVPIGKPASHVTLYLLNHLLQPVPEGTPGELYIARHGIARGYRNDPEKTAKAFVNNPFYPGEVLYRSGDLARFSAPGVLTFLGRIDSQLKISGHRIEPGEIEATLQTHKAIQNSYVTSYSALADSNQDEDISHCLSCGLPSNYPNVIFNDEGVCGVCSDYDAIKDKASAYFETKDSLRRLFAQSRREHNPHYDCMVFYSGGKDSTYTLCKLVDEGLNIYVFTLDNGYLSEQTLANISRVAKTLGVDHEFAKTDSMQEIFKDSLTRFSNVCNGCFKTIYTLGMKRAQELNIPIIVTGLSRGQLFETRLTENMFRGDKFTPADVDIAVLEARKAYHQVDDAVSKCLDTSIFKDNTIFDEIKFIDFYRYWDTSMDELYSYLAERVPWIRPSDTGRSTNCVVNDVGIYIHNKERGYHNYALPYSWDVRMQHKKRQEAMAELDDEYQLVNVKKMLDEIGYDEDRLTHDNARLQLVAYYVADSVLAPSELKLYLNKYLPAQMLPSHLIQLDSIPLTTNGKVDLQALPKPATQVIERSKPIVLPQGAVEEHIHSVWVKTFKTTDISTQDSFFQLGGTSLDAMEVILQLGNDFDVNIPLQTIFSQPTIVDLGLAIEAEIEKELEDLSEAEVEEMLKGSSP